MWFLSRTPTACWSPKSMLAQRPTPIWCPPSPPRGLWAVSVRRITLQWCGSGSIRVMLSAVPHVAPTTNWCPTSCPTKMHTNTHPLIYIHRSPSTFTWHYIHWKISASLGWRGLDGDVKSVLSGSVFALGVRCSKLECWASVCTLWFLLIMCLLSNFFLILASTWKSI